MLATRRFLPAALRLRRAAWQRPAIRSLATLAEVNVTAIAPKDLLSLTLRMLYSQGIKL